MVRPPLKWLNWPVSRLTGLGGEMFSDKSPLAIEALQLIPSHYPFPA